MFQQPWGDGVAGAVRQQIDRPARGQVHDDGAVVVAAADGEVIDVEYGRGADRPVRDCTHRPQQGVAAGRDPEPGSQAGAGASGQRQPDRFEHRVEHGSAAGAPSRQTRYLFGECDCRAVRVDAEESPDGQFEDDRAGIRVTRGAVGRFTLLDLMRVGPHIEGELRFYFSCDGYSDDAIEYADSVGIALFTSGRARTTSPANRCARELVNRKRA